MSELERGATLREDAAPGAGDDVHRKRCNEAVTGGGFRAGTASQARLERRLYGESFRATGGPFV